MEDYKLISLANISNLETELDSLDAVYLTGGLYLTDTQFGDMVETITKKKLPSFSSFGRIDLDRGILATNQPDSNIEQFFRRIALTVEYIVNGTNPSELPMYIDYKFESS